MEPNELKTQIKDFLKEHKSASLATSMNNKARSSPVQYFMGNEMDLYIMSAGGDKFQAIEENPNVCLLVNTEYINYRQIKGVQIFGHAVTSNEDSGLLQEAKRYSPDTYITDSEKESLKVIKITPEEIVYLDSLGDGDRTKQVLKNDHIYIKEDTYMSIH